MSFLKSLYTVLELESSEEETPSAPPPKRARCEEQGLGKSSASSASAAAAASAALPASPLYLNRLEGSEAHSDLGRKAGSSNQGI